MMPFFVDCPKYTSFKRHDDEASLFSFRNKSIKKLRPAAVQVLTLINMTVWMSYGEAYLLISGTGYPQNRVHLEIGRIWM